MVDTKKNKFDSSYRAGKEMVELYNFLFPKIEEQQEFGISLSEVLAFLKWGSKCEKDNIDIDNFEIDDQDMDQIHRLARGQRQVQNLETNPLLGAWD